MTEAEPQPAAPPPTQPFQFSLRTLLLLFVVLGSSLAVFGAWGIAVFGLVVGVAIYLHEAEPLWSWARLALLVIVLLGLAALLVPEIETRREASPRSQCANSLYQIAEALQRYRQVNGSFPPAYIADKNGKPMHSWRVLILPYMDAENPYNKYDFNEPWNGPKNRNILYDLPFTYNCPCDHETNSPGGTETSYVAVVGPNAAWPGDKPRKLDPGDFPGDPSHTVMLVEVTNSGISWTEPRDLSLNSLAAAGTKSDSLLVSSNHEPSNSFFVSYPPHCEARVVMANGSVRTLFVEGLSTDRLHKLLEVGGCPQEAFAAYEVRHLNWPNIAALAVWLLSVGTLLTGAVRSRRKRSVPATPPAS